MKQLTILILLLLVAIFDENSALNIVKDFDAVAEEELNIPNDIYETKNDLTKHVHDKRSDKSVLVNEVPVNLQADSEILETAESNNYVYKPLYVYRKIEHSRRRINMYNAFAG